MELRMPIPLDVIECWDRNVARSLEEYVADLTGHRVEVTVVMPRRDYATLRQRVLHDRTSRRIARAVGRYEHVDVAVVPYFFRRAARNGHAASGDPATNGEVDHATEASDVSLPPDVSVRSADATGTRSDAR
jgi:hypothetical protein